MTLAGIYMAGISIAFIFNLLLLVNLTANDGHPRCRTICEIIIASVVTAFMWPMWLLVLLFAVVIISKESTGT